MCVCAYSCTSPLNACLFIISMYVVCLLSLYLTDKAKNKEQKEERKRKKNSSSSKYIHFEAQFNTSFGINFY